MDDRRQGGRLVAIAIVLIAAACALLGILAFRAILLDGPEDGDPVTLIYAGPLVTIALAATAIWQRRHPGRAAGLIVTSILVLSAWFVLVLLSAG